jgi:thiamine-phosphate pyrophosphorylase
MAETGIEWIQLRAKDLPDDELYEQAEICSRHLEGTSVALWIDDRADLASMLPVAGVHVGQRDLPPGAARQVVGERWIGYSTHDLEQAERADADPEVDVIAFGPIFPTRGKSDPDPVVGLEALGRVRERTRKPLVAIGGIDATNAGMVWQRGADAVAMIGAVCEGEIADNCRRLLDAAKEAS